MKKQMLRLLVLCLFITACSGHPTSSTDTLVSHVVIAWLKEPGNDDARQQFIDMTKRFADIPGVITQRVGKVLRSDRKVVDSSFDVAAVITFKDQSALTNYLQHPLHKKAIEDVLKPLVQRVIVYDFVSD